MKACLTTKPMYCSREYFKTSRLIQQYEKSTSNYICICFSFGGNTSTTSYLRALMKTNEFTREQLLTPENNEDKNIPLMFITTYSRANPNFRELFSKHWACLGRSSATREFRRKDFMITYRKPPSLKDMLVRAKIAQPRSTSYRDCKRSNIWKYFKKISLSGKIKTYTTINPTIQSLKALARAITWYIAWNAIGATLNM